MTKIGAVLKIVPKTHESFSGDNMTPFPTETLFVSGILDMDKLVGHLTEVFEIGRVHYSPHQFICLKSDPSELYGPGTYITVYLDGQVKFTTKPPVVVDTLTDTEYRKLVDQVFETGNVRTDRTGVGTISHFGTQLEFDLRKGFPILTSKFVSLKAVAAELRWFLSGSTNNEELRALGCTIWDEWAYPEDLTAQASLEPWVRVEKCLELHPDLTKDTLFTKLNGLTQEEGHAYLDTLGVPRTKDIVLIKKGELGPVYGSQWRSWPTNKSGDTIDQIAEVLKNLKERPFSRRHIVTGWNPEFLPDESLDHKTNIEHGKQVLPPCHLLFQFYVTENATTKERYLDLQLYQRSADIALGVPYNITSYSLMLALFAHLCCYTARRFVHTFGDYHVYTNHVDTLKTQMGAMVPRDEELIESLDVELDVSPQVTIDPAIKSLDDLINWPIDKPWYTLNNYNHNGKYTYDIAV